MIFFLKKILTENYRYIISVIQKKSVIVSARKNAAWQLTGDITLTSGINSSEEVQSGFNYKNNMDWKRSYCIPVHHH